MSALDFRPELKWVFVFAHPDDELSVAAIARRLVQNSASVAMIWCHATDVRRKEALSALKAIGLPETAGIFLDFSDGDMVEELPRLKSSLRSELERLGPDRVVCAAFEQGHLDHDAVNYALSQVFNGPIYEFPEYWPYTPRVVSMNRFADPTGDQILELSEEEKSWKLELAKSYPSQGIRRYLQWYEAWTAIKGRRARLIETERLRLQPTIDYRSPAVPPAYAAKVLRSKQWARWIRALDAEETNNPSRQ